MDRYVDGNALKWINEALGKSSWDDWLFKDTDRRARLLQLNDKFQGQVKRVRNKFGIDPKTYKSKILDHQKLVNTWLASLDQAKRREWDGYVTYLMYQAHLMPGWRVVVQAYVLSDIFLAPPAILIHDTPDKNMFINLQLMINDQVSKTDFDKLYKYVDNWIEFNKYKLKTKRMPYKNMPFYFIMFDLRKAGLDNSNIAETLRVNFEGEEDTPTFTTRFVREGLDHLEELINAQMS